MDQSALVSLMVSLMVELFTAIRLVSAYPAPARWRICATCVRNWGKCRESRDGRDDVTIVTGNAVTTSVLCFAPFSESPYPVTIVTALA